MARTTLSSISRSGSHDAETVKAEGSKKKAVQQELAGKMLAKKSETFKRPNNYILTFVRNFELVPKLPRTPKVQVEAIPYIRILKDHSSSREKRDMAEAWLKENFDPEMWNAET